MKFIHLLPFYVSEDFLTQKNKNKNRGFSIEEWAQDQTENMGFGPARKLAENMSSQELGLIQFDGFGNNDYCHSSKRTYKPPKRKESSCSMQRRTGT